MPRSKAAQKIIVYWRDIPAQVICKAGRTSAKRELDKRFITAIDACAMRAGLDQTDDYLNAWRKAEPVPCGEDLEAEAAETADAIEAEYTKERVLALVNAGGFENDDK
ncbi:MAG: virulence factor [Hyphomicrobiales bacterium]